MIIMLEAVMLRHWRTMIEQCSTDRSCIDVVVVDIVVWSGA